MPAIVPSQICSFIDTEFKYIPREITPQSQILSLSSSTICGSLRALISLVQQLPNSLLPTDPSDFGDLISSMETIRYTVAMAERKSAIDISRSGDVKLVPGVRPGGLNPVLVIRQVLERCPDESAATASKDFLFVKEPTVRTELLADFGGREPARSGDNYRGHSGNGRCRSVRGLDSSGACCSRGPDGFSTTGIARKELVAPSRREVPSSEAPKTRCSKKLTVLRTLVGTTSGTVGGLSSLGAKTTTKRRPSFAPDTGGVASTATE